MFERLSETGGLDVTVIFQSAHEPGWDAPADWFPAEHPYPSRHLRSWQRRRAGRTPVVWPRGLGAALRETDPDCVVAWEYGLASLRAFAWSRLHRRRFVIFTECTPEIDRLLPPSQLRLHRWLARRADALIVASSAARQRLRSFGVPDERIALGIQSADVAPFRALADGRDGTAGGKPVKILTVGRLVPDKNIATLLEAYKRAGLTADEATLQIVGTGFLEDELRELARRLEVAADFRGHLTPAELPDLYAGADICALVSTYEPFGVVIREAAAAGLPIVCSRVAGAAGDAAVEGRNALLVDPASVDQVADALRRLVDDQALRGRMGRESRAVDAGLEGRDLQAFRAAIAAR
jgi:glycosyltransferase involved in cell wall biosynthesis